MEQAQSVWDFSTPDMEQIHLQSLSSSEDNDVHKALCLFDLSNAPTLGDDSADNVRFHSLTPQYSHDATENVRRSQRPHREASLEHKQASNREHQRRFRMRSKARSQAIEAQLASTTAELQALKTRHQELETMLERASQANQDSVGQSGPSQTDIFSQSRSRGNDIDLSPLLSISIQGKTAHLTAEEVKLMPMPQFSALWTAYVHELGQCLLQLDNNKVGKVEERMMTLSVEGMRLIGRRLLYNPAAHKALITGNLAQGQRTLLHLNPAFYTKLLGVLDLSEGQITDLMHLRRLYLTKRGLLALERKELVTSVASSDQLVHPSDTCARAADVAVSLRENAFQDQQVLYRVARAMWCGVFTTKQLALVMVHAYPYMPIMEHFLDTLAGHAGCPSNPDITSTADAMTADWQDFDVYSKYVHDHMFAMERTLYVPLSQHTHAHMPDKSTEAPPPAIQGYILT